MQSFLKSQGHQAALTWQRLLWQKQLENVLRLKHRQINITRVDTNDLHFEMPEAHTAIKTSIKHTSNLQRPQIFPDFAGECSRHEFLQVGSPFVPLGESLPELLQAVESVKLNQTITENLPGVISNDSTYNSVQSSLQHFQTPTLFQQYLENHFFL